MIEVWLQITCNGCGMTDNAPLPNTTKAEYRAGMSKQYGWRKAPGGLDYCGACVKSGKAARRVDNFGMDEESDGSQTD